MDQAIGLIASGQLGLVTRQQLLALDLSRGQIGHLLSRGELSAVHPGVYRIRDAPASLQQELLAASLRAGSAVVSHKPASWLLGFANVNAEVPEITVSHSRRIDLRGVVVHRTRNLDAEDVCSLGPLLVTTPARTLVDLTDEVDFIELGKLMDEALGRGLTTVAEIRFAIRRRGKRRGRGIRGIDAVKIHRRLRDPSGEWY